VAYGATLAPRFQDWSRNLKVGDKSRLINVGSVVGVVLSVVLGLFQGEMLANRELTIAVLLAITGAAILINLVAKRLFANRATPVSLEGGSEHTPLWRASQTLARVVLDQWTEEATQRGLLGATRMRNPWSVLRPPRHPDAAVWAPDLDAGGSHTNKRLIELMVAITAAPVGPGRGLVLVGDAESGKTAAAALLTLDLLEARQRGGGDGPVPVLLDLASWDEELDLETWLEKRLTESSVWLQNEEFRANGTSGAALLVANHQVLPILDGLDEVRDGPDPDDPASVRADVINELNKSILPGFVLTSDRAVFEAAEAHGAWLAGAVVATLDPGTAAEARRFLEGALPELQIDRWRAVLTELEQRPDGPLGAALTSRLMMALAVEVYGPANTTPETLLSFGERGAIEAHLLDGLVDTAFPRKVPRRSPGGRWRSQDARRWLTHLATATEPHGDIAWWELSLQGGRSTRIIAGVVAFLTVLAAVGLAFAVLFNPVVGVAVGSVLAVVIGLLAAWNDPPKPSELELSIRDHVRSGLKSGLPIGLIVVGIGTVVRDLPFGLTVGLVFGFVIGTLYALTEADPTPQAVTPGFLLQRDLYVGATYGLAYGVPAGFVGWALSGNVITSVLLGLACAAAGALLYGPIWVFALQGSRVGVAAFGHLAIGTLWFASRRKLPWSVLPFLARAHVVGVLRQSGGVYKFRHQRLQEALAKPTPAPTPGQSAVRAAADHSPTDETGRPPDDDAAHDVGDVMLVDEQRRGGDQPAPRDDPRPEPVTGP